MELAAAFAISFILLVTCVFKGIFLAYPLIAVIIIFIIISVGRGFNFKAVLNMAYKGGKKSLVVVKIFVLIGALIPIWTAAGTVPAIVYYGLELIKPELFILCSFLISCIVSFLIGTSVGTSGIVGAAMMVMARGGHVNLAATAGAVIAGVYFGDRCSPVSSSASFVACITETNVYNNIKNMFKTGAVPFAIAVLFYLVISGVYPLKGEKVSINSLIINQFDLSLYVFLPVMVILVLSIFKVNVKLSMLLSIGAAFIISVTVQHESVVKCINFALFGYSLDSSSPLHSIIKGGGIISLMKTALVVYLASAFAGIIEETSMLNSIEEITSRADSRYQIFRNVFITSIFAAMVGCSQTFAVMLTHVLNKKAYVKNNLNNSDAAMDLENTAIMVSGLVPWNVALIAPMTILGIDAACMPYLLYIFLVPLWNLLYLKFRRGSKIESSLDA
ncbi:MAG: Na+/H+ antiporter NhaC family protein [Solirubrobacterales bacterium]